MSERVAFVTEWQRRWEATKGRRVNVAELCRKHGVSRQSGYKWLRRFREADLDIRVLDDQSRRPHSNPRAVPEELADLIVAARKQIPEWGPVLLRAWLVDKHPRVAFPSARCIGDILRRRGLTASKRLRRRGPPAAIQPPFPDCTRPGDVWSMDFKGWFRTGDGEKCFPLTLLDGYSRFLLRCEAFTHPTTQDVERVLDSAFREFGLPKRIRTDGGPPFFAPGSPLSLSRLGVWLLRLGIVLECIAPAEPQQNGRLERFHRTLKRETPIRSDARTQQRAFDEFRRRYNFERPHTQLGLQPPWSVFRRSSRKYPRALLRTEAFGPGFSERADRSGFVYWRKHRIFIGEAFAYEWISFWPTDSPKWEVYFGDLLIGHLMPKSRSPFAGLRRARGPMRLSYLDEDRL
jgi:putative transposase